MVFDGINFKGQTLKIRRPHDYHPTAGGGAAGGTTGALAGVVGGGPENPSMSTSEKRDTKSINVVSRHVHEFCTCCLSPCFFTFKRLRC